MNHFPIFLNLTGARVVFAGAGQAALAKLRLLLKTEAEIVVYAPKALPEIQDWHQSGRIQLCKRWLQAGDCQGAALFYAANEEAQEDARGAALARGEGALVNVIDNLQASDFITPAIVERAPVVVAIGTEGTAPVLARLIKADIEAQLSPVLGRLAAIARNFRGRARALPFGRARRAFWTSFFQKEGPRAYERGGEIAASRALHSLMKEYQNTAPKQGRVDFVETGPGDPELLTLKARQALHIADTVIYDELVAPEILELARREAHLVNIDKIFNEHGVELETAQEKINRLILDEAIGGHHVVRLRSGYKSTFGSLESEIDTAQRIGVDWHYIAGVTPAAAASAAIGHPLTPCAQNSLQQFLTDEDIYALTESQWDTLTTPKQLTAISMQPRTARFFQGRMLMHGAKAQTPVAIITNPSRPDQHIQKTTLGKLVKTLQTPATKGPLVILYGFKPRDATAFPPQINRDCA